MRIVTGGATHGSLRFLEARTLHEPGWLKSRQDFGFSHKFGLLNRFGQSMTSTAGSKFGHGIRPAFCCREVSIFLACCSDLHVVTGRSVAALATDMRNQFPNSSVLNSAARCVAFDALRQLATGQDPAKMFRVLDWFSEISMPYGQVQSGLFCVVGDSMFQADGAAISMRQKSQECDTVGSGSKSITQREKLIAKFCGQRSC